MKNKTKKIVDIIQEEIIAELQERNNPDDGKAAPYGSGYNKVNEDGHMDIPSAIRKCKVIIDSAQDIMEKLGGMSQEQDDLPSWWMDKVTLATDYINKADDYINNSGQINDEKLTEGRPMPMDTPNEFAYKDFKKYVYQKRGMFKKEMMKHVRKSDGQSDSSRMFRTLSALWYKWAYHKARDFRHIKDDQKFGRALMVMMVEDDLIFDKKAWKKDNNMTHVKESKLTEALARGLKPLLQLGSKITKNVGENALMKLSDKFDRIDDEGADDIASHLNMAIELMQDGEIGAATKMFKQFNKKCKDVLKGKSVGSVFEGKLVKESGLRGQIAGDSALDMADYLRRYGVKKILKQPNDRVTYFHLNNASQGRKVVAMLKKMFGIEARIDNHMYSPSPAVRFDNDQLVESRDPASIRKEYKELKKQSISSLRQEWSRMNKVGNPSSLDKEGLISDILRQTHGGKYIDKAFEGKINEMDINDPILIAIRARQTDLKQKAALPKVKKISTKQYYKLMDKESDIINQMKDAAKDYERLDSEMNQDAGQKGSNWTDADANKYGGDLNKLQTRIENLAKEKLKIKKAIMSYRIN